MPLYDCRCEKCGSEIEVLQQFDAVDPHCSCGECMTRKPTFPSMVKWKGDGGYPSLRKASRGSAPFTRNYGKFGD